MKTLLVCFEVKEHDITYNNTKLRVDFLKSFKFQTNLLDILLAPLYSLIHYAANYRICYSAQFTKQINFWFGIISSQLESKKINDKMPAKQS